MPRSITDFTITVKEETHDDEHLFVGRVKEFPNIETYEDTFKEAFFLVLDAILTLRDLDNTDGNSKE